MRAVVERAFGSLREDVLAALTSSEPTEVDVAMLIEHVFEILGTHGQARLMAWLALSGEEPRGRREGITFFVREIAELTHAERTKRYTEAGRKPPPFEDSLFAILLTTLALLGDALLGESARASSGLDDPAAGRRFRQWFAQLLVSYLDGQLAPAAPPKS